jgi:hypothetical protein
VSVSVWSPNLFRLERASSLIAGNCRKRPDLIAIDCEEQESRKGFHRAPQWCSVVQHFEFGAMASKPRHRSQGGGKQKGVRASVSFSADLYAEIGLIARDKKVSVAWVVRDAVEKYVADRYPLFGKS